MLNESREWSPSYFDAFLEGHESATFHKRLEGRRDSRSDVCGEGQLERNSCRPRLSPHIEVNFDFHSSKIPYPRFKTDLARLLGKHIKDGGTAWRPCPRARGEKDFKWLDIMAATFLADEDWPTNSPDLSTMHFSSTEFSRDLCENVRNVWQDWWMPCWEGLVKRYGALPAHYVGIGTNR